jgi:hypothetical protein
MVRGAVAVIAALLSGVALVGCGRSSAFPIPPPASHLCAPQPKGALCLKVFTNNGKTTDVIAYLSASDSPLAGKTWRLVLGWGRAGKTPTRARHGNPPDATFCKDSHGNTITTETGCHDTLASFYASGGDFADFQVPTASVPVPLCVREEVQENGKWIAGPAKQACAPS